jgi:hypothetical protein
MSETELHTGTMKVFERNKDESLGEYFERFLKYKQIDYSKEEFNECFDDNVEDTEENLLEFMSRYEGSWRQQTFIIGYKNNIIFELLKHTYHENQDIEVMTKNADGSYDFVFSFYNGGTSLSEVITEFYYHAVNKS